jgi:ATP-binding cassette, subfamily F, member 3
MLTVSRVAKGYGGRTLFTDANLTVNRGDRIGLVGPNGAGKSTLFKLILRQEDPDDGQVTFQRGTTVGFLPQESAPCGDETVLDLASGRDVGSDSWGESTSGTSSPLSTPIAADGAAVAEAKKILKGLAFRESDYERPARTLSGGWVMRAHLARLLVQQPDLLMLDEPTNHLDLETLLWFQDYLRGYPGGILLISHDREFLNHLITSVIEIRSSRLWRYVGNYDSFLEQRAAQQEQQLAAHKNQQREIERLMDFVDRFRAKNTKAAQAQAKLKQIERMEIIEAPEAAASTVKFSFPQPETSGHRVITLKGIHFSYGSHTVYQGIEFEANKGERVVLVGPNGAGKSTLLKLLAGVVVPQLGERSLGLRVNPGYFSQYRTEMLQPERTVLAEALDTPAHVTELSIRTLLGSFLFRDDDVFKKVEVLSGGEKSRLALVKLLLNPPNLLLMDEPTTHLDMASIDAVISALRDYTGTLIFISHDVYFIKALAQKVVHINAGRLTSYAGGYDYFLEKARMESARSGLTAGLANGRPSEGFVRTSSESPSAGSALQMSQKERRQLAAEARRALTAQRRVVEGLEDSVSRLDLRQAELGEKLQDPKTYTIPGEVLKINLELKRVAAEIAEKTNLWETEATKLALMEGDNAATT